MSGSACWRASRKCGAGSTKRGRAKRRVAPRPSYRIFWKDRCLMHREFRALSGALAASFDIAYRFFDYNTAAFAHHVDIRGKPRPGTDFDVILYGVQDRTGVIPGTSPGEHYSGFNVYALGHLDLGHGWSGTANVNYVSSFDFRQEWSGSFNEAIGSEVHSIGSVSKDFSNFRVDIVTARLENFQSTEVPLTA